MHPAQELKYIMDELSAAPADTAKMRTLQLHLTDLQSQRQGIGHPIRDGERRPIGSRHVVDGIEMITLETKEPT